MRRIRGFDDSSVTRYCWMTKKLQKNDNNRSLYRFNQFQADIKNGTRGCRYYAKYLTSYSGTLPVNASATSSSEPGIVQLAHQAFAAEVPGSTAPM